MPAAPGGMRAFVQMGATRDGLDPYLDCARRRDLPAVLVETPAYLRWRGVLGRRGFDVQVGVEHPDDPRQVLAALADRGIRPALVLAGFERYAPSAFALARLLGVPPSPGAGPDFVPMDKREQRALLTRRAPRIHQPGYVCWQGGPAFDDAVAALRFPQVVKPADGGGGLGVFLVHDAAQRARALRAVRATRNYDGGTFAGILVEEYIAGVEYSIQGLAHAGQALVLSVCEKLTAQEPAVGDTGLRGFRELGHIGTHGACADPALPAIAQQCLAAVGYREGPFHIDVIGGAGYTFVEMGFRLSGGGLVGLVENVTGVNWAELAFRLHLDGEPPRLPPPGSPPRVVGQVTVVDESEFAAAAALGRRRGVKVHRGTPAPADADPARDPRLASDRMRHTGIGRVVLGGALDEVRAGLRRCVAGRLTD